jgi:uncharacterized protein (TIGR02453 family)
MVPATGFTFLNKLSKNNNREWFTENKTEFKKVEAEMKLFFNVVFAELNLIDDLESLKIFRIYKDVRFSKDKTPYKINFSAGVVRTKPQNRGGFYLHIENNNSFIGGGFWDPNKEDLFRIRKEFELDVEEIQEIENQDTFKNYFGKITGEELKTAPKGFDKELQNIEYIRKKQFLVTRTFTNEEVLSASFEGEIVKTYQAMLPFFNYMTAVLTTNLNGESLL